MNTTKIRYTTQRRNADCFPTAIANACKWAGESFSYRENFHEINRFFKTEKYGTDSYIATYLLKKHKSELPFKSTLKRNITLKQIRKHLKNNGSILLIYYHPNFDNYHTALIINTVDKDFLIVNHKRGKCISRVKNTDLSVFLRFNNLGYFLERK